MEKENIKKGLDLKEHSGRKKDTNTVGKHYFLGIGINNYQNHKHLHTLRNAIKDVEDISGLLKEKYSFNIINPLYDDSATKENLEKRVQEIYNKINSKDDLIIYFSGHGGYKKSVSLETGSGYWCLYNYDGDAGALNIREIIDSVHDLECTLVLIIENCCQGATADEEVRKWPIRQTEKEGFAYLLSSASKDEYAFDGTGENSPFAKSLIQVLRENNKDELTLNNEDSIRYLLDYNKAYYRIIYQNGGLRAFAFYKDSPVKSYPSPESVFKQVLDSPTPDINDIESFSNNVSSSKFKKELNIKKRAIKEANKVAENKKTSKKISLDIDFIFENKNSANRERDIKNILTQCRKNQYIVNYLEPEQEKRLEIIKKRDLLKQDHIDYPMVCIGNLAPKEGFETAKFHVGLNFISTEIFYKFKICARFEDYNFYDSANPGAPSVMINWIDAIACANWLSNKNNLLPFYKIVGSVLVGIEKKSNGFRLPTKNEWELFSKKDNSIVMNSSFYEWCWDFKGTKQIVINNVGDIDTYKELEEENHISFRFVRSNHSTTFTPPKSTATSSIP